jgi:adenylate cyclase
MRRHLDWVIPFLILLGALALQASDGPIVVDLRNRVFDIYQRLQPRPYLQDVPVRILAIDEQSLRRIGQWPWPRDVLARLIDRVTSSGAAAVALDMLLAEPDRTAPQSLMKQWEGRSDIQALEAALSRFPDPDAELAKALSKAPTVVAFALNNEAGGPMPLPKAGFATAGDDPLSFLQSRSGATVALKPFEIAAAGNGNVTTSPDADGIFRRVALLVSYQGKIFPSLAAEALRVAQGASTYVVKSSGASGEESFGTATGLNHVKIGAAVVPVDPNGNILLYDTGYRPQRFIPAWKMLTPEFDPALVAGKVILIGATVEGLRDYKPTPLDPAMAGVEIHAQVLEQIIGGQYLRRVDWAGGAEKIFLGLLGLILIVLIRRYGAFWSAMAGLIAVAAAIAISWLAFTREALLFDPIYPSFAALAIYLSSSLLGYLRTEGERRQVRKAFSQYLAPAIVEELSRHPERLKLGGELRELTVMFSDVREFTRIAEKLHPQELTHMINAILTPLTAAIHERKGTIDKYIGDCIMAFWNAPLDDGDHQRNALLAALAMREALASANERLLAEAAKAGRATIPIGIGIGINSGPCSVGNMGSDQRFAYSALGDTVNLASRLESLTRSYGVDIIVGEEAAAGIEDMALLEIDRVRVKGRSEPLTIYTLLGATRDGAFARLAVAHKSFLAAYRRQDWTAAKAKLAELCEIAPSMAELSQLFTRRMANYEAQPPAPDWDGVYVAASKTG